MRRETKITEEASATLMLPFLDAANYYIRWLSGAERVVHIYVGQWALVTPRHVC